MRGDPLPQRFIQFVVGLGILSALFTVGGDVLGPDDGEVGPAAAARDAPESGPLGDADLTVPTPTNASSEQNGSHDAPHAACAPACELLLA